MEFLQHNGGLKMENVNGVPKEYSISLTQTAKGIYYVDRLKIEANTLQEMMTMLSSTMVAVNAKLKEVNGE